MATTAGQGNRLPDPDSISELLAGGHLTIDTQAIARNWRSLRDRLRPGSACAATVKADAYGTGLIETSKALADAGCTTFFVALPLEAIRLRKALPKATIYVLNGLFPNCSDAYAVNRIRPVLGSMPEIIEWASFCRATKEAHPAAIHIDTGMNRLGLRLEAFKVLMADPELLASFDPCLLMSHLACGSTPDSSLNAKQLDLFTGITGKYSHIPRSLSNSAGVFLGHEYHFDLARPGIALYGGRAVDTPGTELEPVAKVEARILVTREVPAGETIGYGAAQTAQRDMTIAVVASGYADGLLRRAGSSDNAPGAFAVLAGRKVPLVGRVSMDMIAIDVTDVPQPLARRGAFVEMLGPNVAAADLAAYAQTIDYEYLTSLGRRFLRHYGPLAA
ncbi:alanine racemase [Roseibium sp. RKSG952]|uniref:alanine racemase n=1 Tax=Roseibium sp. RKSG952 TaxID=2529384 RepID=UPI001FCAAD8A|nr:alanine racemase [Roseibium sp. RKSG952]